MASNLNKGTAFKSLKLGSLVLTNADYDELYDLIAAKVASVGATTNAGIEVGGTATAPTVGIKLDPTTGNLASLGAGGLMVSYTPGVYSLQKKTTANTGASSTYQLTLDGTVVSGAAEIDIPKDMVVSGGEVKTVTTADTPYTGALVGDKYIELTIANANSDKLYIPVKDLVDVYTGAAASDGIITVAVSNGNVITATIADASITAAKLAGSIPESKLDSACQTKIDNGDAAKTAVDGILNGTDIDSFGDVETALAGKQATLTFDSSPTSGSDNPVKSGGVFTALAGKCDKVNDLTDDTTVSSLLSGIGCAFSAS